MIQLRKSSSAASQPCKINEIKHLQARSKRGVVSLVFSMVASDRPRWTMFATPISRGGEARSLDPALQAYDSFETLPFRRFWDRILRQFSL